MSAPELSSSPSLSNSHNSNLITHLYVAHFLARWGARMWEFSVGLYMIKIWPNSLLFAAVYGAVESASIALFGATIGQWVDRLTYVQVLHLWLVTKSICFVVAGGAVVALLIYPGLKTTNLTAFIFLVILTNIAGAVGVLSTLAGTILIEREWVVVISTDQPPEVLPKLNSVLRRIDLISKLLAPVATGFIISFVSMKASAIALALWSAISVWLQYWLIMSVYHGISSLKESNQKRISRLTKSSPKKNTPISQETNNSLSYDGSAPVLPKNNWRKKISKWVSRISWISAWRIYLRQEVVLPGVALALLYFTVLSFGTLMTAALGWEGIHAYVIGIARAVSALIGISATFLYPILQFRISTVRTGFWSIWFQWSFLLVSVGSIWVQNKIISPCMLMGGVAVSRFGLWMFDLAVTQQMQDHVPESDRCVVGGVQNSLQSSLELLSYVMGIIISNPEDFWKLILLSVSAVTLASMLYSSHIYRDH